MLTLYDEINTIEEYDLRKLRKENRWLRQQLEKKTENFDMLGRQYNMLISVTRKLYTIYKEEEEDNKWHCPICEESEPMVACIPCGHRFCEKCLTPKSLINNVVVTQQCAICRAMITNLLKIY